MRWIVASAVALVVLTGCAPVAPTVDPAPSPTVEYDVPPRWVDDASVEGIELTFAAGAELVPGSDVEFRSRLGDVYDWEVVGSPTASLRELVNSNAGCRVRDETQPYVGAATNDETASVELVSGLVVGFDLIGGPSRTVAGIDEGLGEGGPMYQVSHVLAQDPDGGYRYVAGRVFTTLGIQHAITIDCEQGGYLDRTRGQVATTTWVHLDLLG